MNLKGFLIGLDQAVNCLVRLSDGWGWPDETLSARAWRLREQHPKLYLWIDRIMFFDRNHCQKSYVSEINRLHFPKAYRP